MTNEQAWELAISLTGGAYIAVSLIRGLQSPAVGVALVGVAAMKLLTSLRRRYELSLSASHEASSAPLASLRRKWRKKPGVEGAAAYARFSGTLNFSGTLDDPTLSADDRVCCFREIRNLSETRLPLDSPPRRGDLPRALE
jgi:hypothetical protein